MKWVIDMPIIEYIKSKIVFPLPAIGKRNIKSAIGIIACFLAWQIIRLFLPSLEIHPLYGYISIVLIMRDTIDKSFRYGRIRVKGTIIGLVVALVFISIYTRIQMSLHIEGAKVFVELIIIVFGASFSLYVAHVLKCNNLCAIACSVFLVCMIRQHSANRYSYAILRASETIFGLGISLLINRFVFPYKPTKDSEKAAANAASGDGLRLKEETGFPEEGRQINSSGM